MKLKFFLIFITLLIGLLAYLENLQIGSTFAQEGGLVAKYLEGRIPLTDPKNEIWDKIDGMEVVLGPQLTALPWIHPEPSIRSLSVKAINNGSWISFRLEWSDETKDEIVKVDAFRDAVAIMLGLQAGVGQCMGTPTAEALIAQWKADFQKDIDKAFSDIAELYPNFWSDWYIMAVGKPPYDLPSIYTNYTKIFVGGWAVNNPLSNPYKLTPVETLVAGGWGTLTTYKTQQFIGKGIYEEGKWKVVISRPLITGEKDPQWFKGPVEIAFAAWDGAKGEVGAKKGVSLPMLLTLEKPVIGGLSPSTWQWLAVLGTWVLAIAIILLIGRK